MTDSLTLTSWTDRAAGLTLPSRQIIGGPRVESRTSTTADVVSPRDGTVIAAVPDCYKQSGNGRDKSQHALEKYTELKTTWVQS
jgi:acyl-CoA reductase-like NAD-dependent aldehyde dehydrogenase